MTPGPRLTIVGAGLAGALLATLLARRGWQVDVFERRGDPRLHGYAGGRSINLALAERGLHALRQADADGAVLERAVMMRGRMVHPLHGQPQLQRYGRDDSEVIWSVSRGELNISLLDAAEAAGATLHFDRGLASVDFDRKVATYNGDGGAHEHPFEALLGCDGAGSTLRAQMGRHTDLGERTAWLEHGYKELEIPPANDGGFRIEPNALHIWPRGRYMCIALPNDERTFTVTLFMALHGDGSDDPDFDSVSTAAEARALFARDFADTLPLIPELEQDFEANPTGTLATLYLDRWHLDGHAVLLGDAAHAMVPFHGQGMNCAFEDCSALAAMIRTAHSGTPSWPRTFEAFASERKPNTDAIAEMALHNFIEMRDKTASALFRMKKKIEHALHHVFPKWFMPLYNMISFSTIPYAQAQRRARAQANALRAIVFAFLVLLAIAVGLLIFA